MRAREPERDGFAERDGVKLAYEVFGADPARLTLSGSSAGAHLQAMALAHDWPAEGLPAGDADALVDAWARRWRARRRARPSAGCARRGSRGRCSTVPSTCA